MERLLPAEFADLEEFARDWALPTEAERYDKREASSFEEIVRFYDALLPRAEAATAYLDRLPLDDLPADAKSLLHLLFSLVTISFAVEVWKQPKTPDTGSAKLVAPEEPLPA